MKNISEIVTCVLDYGSFISLADMMGQKCKTYFHSPFQQEYLCLEKCCIGDGFDSFERVDDYMEPEFYAKVDLWIFPDIGYGGFQRFLRREGKAVWGSMGASDLELYRTRFLKVIKELGLPVINSITCRGITELTEHLKSVEDKWVKINRYRENQETFHWQDWMHGQRDLERLAHDFGPLKERVVFVVQDCIKGEHDNPVLEVGYDGWFITEPDGTPSFPPQTFQGYEAKNELYLGSLLDYGDLPEAVQEANKAFAPVLAEYGYRNFMATEIRIKDGTPYFIDPTCRMAGQTQEHLLNTCTNLAEIIWAGANGQVIKPEFSHQFAAESTLHYKGGSDCWKTLVVPESIEDKVKPYHCCFEGGAYQFPPHKTDELGVIIGQGDSIEDAVEDLKDNFAELEHEPVTINVAGFVELIEQIQDAEEKGVEFSDQPVPAPETAIS